MQQKLYRLDRENDTCSSQMLRSALPQRPAAQPACRQQRVRPAAQPACQQLARRQQRCVRASAAPDAAVAAALSLLLAHSGAPDLYAATEETAAAVNTLVQSQPGPADASAAATLGDGKWEVFFGPHFRRVERLAKFQPVRYVISGGGTRMRSDVHFELPFASGWLSSEGGVEANGDGSVNVLFETFWLEGDSPEPRAENPLTSGAPVPAQAAAINGIGRLGFLPSLSRFPVRFMDAQAGVCVFEFPPLQTVIAARRL
jgi:hypothetical protein